MVIKLSIDNNISNTNLALIKDYWAFDGRKYSNKVGALATKFGMKKFEVLRMAMNFSRLHFNIGHCVDCGKEVLASTNLQLNLKQVLKESTPRCKACHSNFEGPNRIIGLVYDLET